MKTELIQALSNANINSDSVEIIASEYISYLYFSEIIENITIAIIVCSTCMVIRAAIK